MQLFTIGHSNHSIEKFIELLQAHGVNALADVRSNPYSRYLPHFNQAALKTTLLASGIQYVFLGHELGARPDDPGCYVDGKALYEKIAATERFSQGIERILKGVKRYTIALMCAEKDPIVCHRAILVCPHLRAFNIEINHIHKNSELENHRDLETRLLKQHGFEPFTNSQNQSQLSLFGDDPLMPELSREESLQEAYRKQGLEIAYVEKSQDQYEQVS